MYPLEWIKVGKGEVNYTVAVCVFKETFVFDYSFSFLISCPLLMTFVS